jgi:hypothetical protein
MGVIWTRHAEERWQESLDTLLDKSSRAASDGPARGCLGPWQ